MTSSVPETPLEAFEASLVPRVEAALVDWEATVDCGAHAGADAPPPEDEGPIAPDAPAAPAPIRRATAAADLAPAVPLSRALQGDGVCLPAPLRHLDQLRLVDTPSSGGEEGYHAAGLALRQRVVNTDLLDDDWLAAVFDRPDAVPLSATLFELNDPSQFFEPNGPASAQAGLGLDRAGALLLPMPPKVCLCGCVWLQQVTVCMCKIPPHATAGLTTIPLTTCKDDSMHVAAHASTHVPTVMPHRASCWPAPPTTKAGRHWRWLGSTSARTKPTGSRAPGQSLNGGLGHASTRCWRWPCPRCTRH